VGNAPYIPAAEVGGPGAPTRGELAAVVTRAEQRLQTTTPELSVHPDDAVSRPSWTAPGHPADTNAAIPPHGRHSTIETTRSMN